jgi:glycerol-3-phosphate dehydrogenase
VIKGNQVNFTVKPRKGQFLVFERELVRHSILPVWNERTKGVKLVYVILYACLLQGVLLSPSLYSQMIIGPTAEEQSERDFATTGKLHWSR